MINPGDLDRRIRLERATTAANAANELVPTWSTLATVWASWQPIRDGEKWAAGQVGATVTDRFQIRWSSTVSTLNPKDRLVYNGRTYEIHGVKELGRREGIEITAEARVD